MKSKFTLRKKCLEKRDIFFKNKGSECLKFKDIKAIILEIKSKIKYNLLYDKNKSLDKKIKLEQLRKEIN